MRKNLFIIIILLCIINQQTTKRINLHIMQMLCGFFQHLNSFFYRKQSSFCLIIWDWNNLHIIRQEPYLVKNARELAVKILILRM